MLQVDVEGYCCTPMNVAGASSVISMQEMLAKTSSTKSSQLTVASTVGGMQPLWPNGAFLQPQATCNTVPFDIAQRIRALW